MDSKFIDMIEELINTNHLEIEELQSEIQSVIDQARIYQSEATDPSIVAFELYNNRFEFYNPSRTYISSLDVTREMYSQEDTITLEIHAPIGGYKITHKGDKYYEN